MENPYKGKVGIQRLWNALKYSLAGLRAAYHYEDAFRQELVLALFLIPVALFVPPSPLGKAILVSSVLLVLVVELINSALEAAVDRISLENHLLAKRAKDIGSAAVMVSLVNLAVTWALVLIPGL